MKNKIGLITAGLVSTFLMGCSDNSSVSYYEKHPEQAKIVYKACSSTKELDGKSLSEDQCENALKVLRKIRNEQFLKTK